MIGKIHWNTTKRIHFDPHGYVWVNWVLNNEMGWLTPTRLSPEVSLHHLRNWATNLKHSIPPEAESLWYTGVLSGVPPVLIHFERWDFPITMIPGVPPWQWKPPASPQKRYAPGQVTQPQGPLTTEVFRSDPLESEPPFCGQREGRIWKLWKFGCVVKSDSTMWKSDLKGMSMYLYSYWCSHWVKNQRNHSHEQMARSIMLMSF